MASNAPAGVLEPSFSFSKRPEWLANWSARRFALPHEAETVRRNPAGALLLLRAAMV